MKGFVDNMDIQAYINAGLDKDEILAMCENELNELWKQKEAENKRESVQEVVSWINDIFFNDELNLTDIDYLTDYLVKNGKSLFQLIIEDSANDSKAAAPETAPTQESVKSNEDPWLKMFDNFYNIFVAKK